MPRRDSIKRNKLPTKFTKERQELFLKLFVECNSVKQASALCKVKAQTVYYAIKNDPLFAQKYDDANKLILDNLEKEAYRRAVTGVKKPVYHQGRVVGYELEYSDKLLEMLLRGRSDKYSNKTAISVAGNIDHNHNVTVDNVKDKLLKKALERGYVIDVEAEEVEEVKDDEESQGE